jgi:hypothetical protein
MHAILQKHQLRPATQPSSARLGKPACTALPPPGPTPPRLPSRQQHGAELLAMSSRADSGSPTRGAGTGMRVVSSSSGRKFCLSSVEDLLTTHTSHALDLPHGSSSVNAALGASALPPRPATQGNDGGRRAPGDGYDHERRSAGSGIPRLSSAAAAGEFSSLGPAEVHNHHPIHHVLAQEIAKMVRRLPTPTSDGGQETRQQHPPLQSESRNSFRGHGRLLSSEDLHHHDSASPTKPKHSVSHQTSWATFASQASDDEVMALLKLVLVRLLSGATLLSQSPPKTVSRAGKEPTHPPQYGRASASSVFQKMCVAFAEATGEAPMPPPMAHNADSPRADHAMYPRHQQRPPTWQHSNEEVAWRPSPRLETQQHQLVDFGPRHTSMRAISPPLSSSPHLPHPSPIQQNPMTVDVMNSTRSLMMSGNEHALVSDAVLFRQIGILRRERDEMRREVEALRAELQRQVAAVQ